MMNKADYPADRPPLCSREESVSPLPPADNQASQWERCMIRSQPIAQVGRQVVAKPRIIEKAKPADPIEFLNPLIEQTVQFRIRLLKR